MLLTSPHSAPLSLEPAELLGDLWEGSSPCGSTSNAGPQTGIRFALSLDSPSTPVSGGWRSGLCHSGSRSRL